MNRIEWVDTAKAILISLVVYGHFRGKYPGVPGTWEIYAFHVPAFLIITGYLLPLDFDRKKPKELWGRWLVVFIKAYLFFSLISLVIWTFMAPVTLVDIPQLLKAIFYGVDGRGNGLGHRNAPLWYFPFLVSSIALYWAIGRLPKPWHLLGLAAVAIFAVTYDGPRWPWSFELAGIGAVMLWAGQWFKGHEARIAPVARHPVAWGAIVALGALLIVQVHLNGRININNASFGLIPPLVFTSALTGGAMVILLAMKLPSTALARWLSRHTLVIFSLHLYLILHLAPLLPPQPNVVLRVGLLAVSVLLIMGICGLAAHAMVPILKRVMARQTSK